jgi:hypothetical protein
MRCALAKRDWAGAEQALAALGDNEKNATAIQAVVRNVVAAIPRLGTK